MKSLLPIQIPEDGFDDDEKAFAKQMYIEVYQRISNPVEKFVIFAVLDMGLSQELVGEMLGVSQVTVSKTISKVKSRFQHASENAKV